MGNGAVSYTVAPNAAPLLRTATLTIAGKPYRVTQSPCTFTLDATATTPQPAGGGGSVAVTTGDACPWTSTSSVPWASITSPTPQTGNGSASFSVLPNTTLAVRTTLLMIAGKPYRITQAACTYTLGIAAPPFEVNGGAGNVTLTTQDGCPWMSVSNATWVVITSPSPQTGPGAVSYTVAPNTVPLLRTAMLTIAGKPYKVTQAACTFTLDANATTLPPAGGSGSVTVTTGDACGWTSKSPVPWTVITSPSPQTGNGSVGFTVSPNTTPATRTASLMIAGKPYKITQAACTYTLGATTQAFPVNGGAGNVALTTQDGCPWTTTTTAPWVTITSPSPQTGTGSVSYAVAPTTVPQLRTATVTIAGKPYKVTQAACAFTLDGTATTLPPAGGGGTVGVTTGDACGWTSKSPVPWVTLTSPSSQTGNGSVSLTVAANTTPAMRATSLMIAGKPYKVTQTPCTYTLSASGASFIIDGGGGSVTVTASDGCPWTSTTSAPWVTITSASPQTGNGIVNYAVAVNTTAATRTAILAIAGKSYTVTQSAGASKTDLRITLAPPGNLTTGKVARPPVTVRNAGSVPSGGFDVGLFVSPTNAPGTGMEVRRHRINQLNPGTTVPVDIDVSLPNNVEPGQYFMSVVADVDNTVTQAPGNHTAVAGPFKVGLGVDKFREVSANVTFSTGASAVTFAAAPCGITGSLNLSGGSSVGDPLFNADGSVTATGNVTLNDSVRSASFVGTFHVTVDVNNLATLSFAFNTVTLPGFSGTATATATGSIKVSSGAGQGGGAGAGLGFAFESAANGFRGQLTGTGCAFIGSFKATVEQIFDLFFVNLLDAGAFGKTELTPLVEFPVPFSSYEAVLSVVDTPNTLPAPGTVVFTGPSGSNLNGVPADAASSGLDQGDGFALYLTPFIDSSTGPPDGTYTVTYKSGATFEANLDASHRAVIPFPTVTLNPVRDLQRLSWQYRNRETGAPIPTPSFIGLIGVFISSVNSSGTLDFCFSPFFDRTVTSFTPTRTADCPNLIHWDDIFILSFIYVDSLTFNAYGVSFDGPRLSFPQLAVGVVGPGTVTSSPDGISCGTKCLASFARGSTVTLTAEPAIGAIFLGWTGACSGSSRTCLVTMSTDREVGAAFATAPQVRFLNGTCVAPSCAPYTATLTSTLGERHTWSSVSEVASPYQVVFSTFLNGFTVSQGAPFNRTLQFGGDPFQLTPGLKYTIVLNVDESTQQYVLTLVGTTSAAAAQGTRIRQTATIGGSRVPSSAMPIAPRSP